MARRHKSQSHQRAVAWFLGYVTGCAPMACAPPVALFAEILKQFQNGLDPTGGCMPNVGMVSPSKANAMLWFLSEVVLQAKREQVQRAVRMNVTRDERHGRLRCRFRRVSGDF